MLALSLTDLDNCILDVQRELDKHLFPLFFDFHTLTDRFPEKNSDFLRITQTEVP